MYVAIMKVITLDENVCSNKDLYLLEISQDKYPLDMFSLNPTHNIAKIMKDIKPEFNYKSNAVLCVRLLQITSKYS